MNTASELKSLTEYLAPSLAETQFLPILNNICFDKEHVYAYNDVVATLYSWKHGLGRFAVNGRAFSQLLSQWGDQEVHLSLEKNVLHLTCGSSKAKLPTLGADAFVFERPQKAAGTIALLGNSEEERERLSECLQVVASSAANQVFKAVTFATDKMNPAMLYAYATNGVTLIQAQIGKLKTVPNAPKTWVVPKLAVQQMLAVMKLGEGPLTVTLTTDTLTTEAKDAGLEVISKLIAEDAPNFNRALDFEAVGTIQEWKKNNRLLAALGVAAVMQDSFKGQMLNIFVEKGKLRLASKGKDGEATDEVKFDKMKLDHEFQFYINPDAFKRAFQFKSLDDKSKLVLGPRSLAFGDRSSFLYAVAHEVVKE